MKVYSVIACLSLVSCASATASGPRTVAPPSNEPMAETAGVTPPRAPIATVPACRMIATPAILDDTMHLLLKRAREMARAGTASASRKYSVPSDVEIVLVEDALATEVDAGGCRRTETTAVTPDALMRTPIDKMARGPGELDSFSVRGGCKAGGGQVRCSRAAVELVLAKDESSEFSPTLFYVLGHELAHLLLGHTSGALATSAPGADQGSRLRRALHACQKDVDVIQQENDADRLAIEMLAPELKAREIADDRVFDGVRALYSWLLWTPGQSASIERGATFCAFLHSPALPSESPVYGGSHPRWSTRLADIARATGVLDAPVLKYSAMADEQWVDNFCSEAHAFEAQRLKCDDSEAAPMFGRLKDGSEFIMLTREPVSAEVAAMVPPDPTNETLAKACKSSPSECKPLKQELAGCKAGSLDRCAPLAHYLSHELFERDEAAQVYHYACRRNDPMACMQLATLYKVGALGPQSPMGGGTANGPQARKWYSKACELGDPQGCFETAILYYEDINLPRIYTLGLMNRACKGGIPRACQRKTEVSAIAEDLRRSTGLKFATMPFEQVPLH